MDAVAQRLATRGLNRRQPVAQHGGEDIDHLPVAVIDGGELAPNTLQTGRQHPVLERRAIAQGTRLARQDRHIMPGIEDRLIAPEAPPAPPPPPPPPPR